MTLKKENVNYPKCVNCLQNGCFAGIVNHNIRRLIREECLLNCGCIKFVETKLSREQLDDIIKNA